MHTVPIERSNLADCAWIASAAYAPNPFFSEWLRPHPTSFPDHNRHMFVRRLKDIMHSSHKRTQVMVRDSSDPASDKDGAEAAEGTAMGFASWERILSASEKASLSSGSSASSTAGTSGRQAVIMRDRWPTRTGLVDSFERWAVDKQVRYHALVRTDRSYDVEHFKLFRKQMRAIHGELIETMKTHSQTGGCIYLDELVVDPRFQGRGVGKALLKQGIEYAEQERVPIGLVATVDGEFLYKKMGFKTVGEDWLLGEAGHQIMVYWPGGQEPEGLRKFKVMAGEVQSLE